MAGNSGRAYFRNVLIGTGYTQEEADVPGRYVIPSSQSVAIERKTVTRKTFENQLKKWNAAVTKRDSETGSAQGDASLAGATYGVYQGDAPINTYTTDAAGQFTTDYYPCGDDWSIREITPSEGCLPDSASHHVGAESRHYTTEYNSISMDMAEQVIKGSIAIIKHTGSGETQLEAPEAGAVYPQSQVQRCGVHQIRSSTRFVSHKDIKPLMAALKKVYSAVTKDKALENLMMLKDKWEKQYPSCVKNWEENC